MSRGVRHVGAGRRLAAAVAAVVAPMLLSAGCASPAPPGQAVPELDAALSQVDRAVVDHRPGRARRQLRQLIRTTVEARDAGRLDSAQADSVLAAAAGLLDALPRPTPEPEPSPTTPAPQPEPTKAAPDEKHHDHGHGDHDHGHGHHDHGHAKKKEKQDEGDGDHGGESDEDD